MDRRTLNYMIYNNGVKEFISKYRTMGMSRDDLNVMHTVDTLLRGNRVLMRDAVVLVNTAFI